MKVKKVDSCYSLSNQSVNILEDSYVKEKWEMCVASTGIPVIQVLSKWAYLKFLHFQILNVKL